MIQSYNVYEIFTPSKVADINYIERKSINGRIDSALRTPGRQIIIFGHSGVGKSSLLKKALQRIYEREITTNCMKAMNFDGIILDAFDNLNGYYADKVTHSKTRGSKVSLSGAYLAIKASFEKSKQSQDTVQLTRLVSTQLTPQRLADFLGEGKYCWVLEDFHKIPEKEKIKLSQIMKVFMDKASEYPTLKIIALGAVNTGREVVQYDLEMKNRIAEIEVSLMSKDELKEIITNGERMLKIHFADEIKREIIDFSNGLASVCHALCLYMCEEKGVLNTITDGDVLKLGKKDLTKAITRYISEQSDSIKHKFDLAFKQKESKYKNAELIFRALSKLSPEGATHAEILRTIRDERSEYPQSNLTINLNQLLDEKKGAIIRFNNNSGKYFFSEPFYRPYILALFQNTNYEEEARNSLKNTIGKIAFDFIVKELESRYNLRN